MEIVWLLGRRVGNFAEMHLTATKWQGGIMSKILRVAEFAAASWLLFGALVGTWAMRDFLAAAPLPFSVSFGVTEAIVAIGSIWHIIRAVRGR